MRHFSKAMCLLAVGLMAGQAGANPAEHVQQAGHAAVGASGQSTASVGHSLAATGKLASGMVATPVLASGVLAVGAGSAAVHSGAASAQAATQPIGQPLPLTRETVSVLPPNQALQTQRPAAQ